MKVPITISAQDFQRAKDRIKQLDDHIAELERRLDNAGDLIEELVGFINIPKPKELK